jgi:hypothetical protein
MRNADGTMKKLDSRPEMTTVRRGAGRRGNVKGGDKEWAAGGIISRNRAADRKKQRANHKQQLAACRHDIDQLYRAEFLF